MRVAPCNISTAASAPRCGAPDPAEKRASGAGTVYATSLVCRAATPETRAHVPYNIVLVDTVEGFRMMAHGDNDLAIGDNVTAGYRQFAGRLVPYFEKTSEPQASNAHAAKQLRTTRNGEKSELLRRVNIQCQ